MKNSKEYGNKVDKFIRSAKAGMKVKPSEFDEPLDALVYGLISETTTEKHSKKVYKNLMAHFVDLNDLRVCRAEEIQEILEDPTPKGELAAENLTKVLTKVFDKYDSLSLKGLDEQGKRQAKKDIEELDGVSRFAVNFCFLAAFGGHAIPLTESMLSFLRNEGLVDPNATPDEVEGFLERHIQASSGWEFYELLRQAAENAGKKTVTAKPAAKSEKKPAVKKKTK